MKVVYNVCPNKECGKTLDGATNADDINDKSSPEPGDVSICTYCETFLVYDDTMTLQFLDPDKESPITMLGLEQALRYIRELKVTGELE